MTRQKRGALFGLRPSLEHILERAQNSTNRGSERTDELKHELRDIDKRVKKTLDRITKEAESSTDRNADEHARAKQTATFEILETELVRLAALYHRQSDVEMIQHFIREQRMVISDSMEATTKKPSLVSLDNQISQLHDTLAEERVRVRRNAHKDWIKFWVSVSIGLISLGISVYALAFR